MTAIKEKEKHALHNLEDCISRAMNKVKAQKEADLCKYLPSDNGRLHHFSFNKMKHNEPSQLSEMIQGHILDKATPEQLPPTRRSSFGKKQSPSLKLNLKREHINRILESLKKSGDNDLLEMIAPLQSLKEVQREMLNMVRSKEINRDLWSLYVKLVEKEQSGAE